MIAAVDAATAGEPVERELMSWDEIREMHTSGLVRFGSHTRRHTRLSAVRNKAELQDEIAGSRRDIEAQLKSRPASFCYPNGDLSPDAVSCVRAAYRGAVTTRSGWNRPGTDPCLLKRVGMHEDVSATRAGFLARLAGVG
jgi:peptidoglycan/xylan/chitin deacetylase (PgdA/CDA1 family)